MPTPLLIQQSDFAPFIELPSNLSANKLSPQIRKAQDFDLCALMGNQFYYYFLSFFDNAGVISPTAPQAIIDLYSGSTYVIDNITYPNDGIKPVLVHFAAAKLVHTIDLHITPHSFAQKINEYSEQPSQGRRIFTATEYENTALAYWNKLKPYLTEKSSDYPQYFINHCGCGSLRNDVRVKRVSVGGCNG